MSFANYAEKQDETMKHIKRAKTRCYQWTLGQYTKF